MVVQTPKTQDSPKEVRYAIISNQGEIPITKENWEEFKEKYKSLNHIGISGGRLSQISIYAMGGVIQYDYIAYDIRLIHSTNRGLERLAKTLGLPRPFR